ncbi:MerR family transcriptional regulator [Bacillus dakarensis]|uniref:MerR family transcriptional regulator n=1 Tax=Robertmurraya dakarensis TaxID=1926278 RepID=UPI000981AAF4|nr:MerR family transcriptional regulator [Bacillus dakarensis]
MSSNQILRAYSIKEVSKKINIPTGTIRQWEKDLNGLLIIPRTKQGARFYTEKEIDLLKKVKEMREQNVSKDMIRIMMQKHLAVQENESADSVEMFPAPLQVPENQESSELSSNQVDKALQEFHATLEQYKQEMINEIKTEMAFNRNEIIDEVKNELLTSSLHTVKELSKSIQRSNDKRKGELQEISGAITKASERHSESVATLSDRIAKNSKGTYEQLSKRIADSSRTAAKDQKLVLNKVSKTVEEAKLNINKVAKSIDEKQEQLIETINELKQSTEEIQQREDVFQNMLTSYREVAAAKTTKKKKWWQIWS